MCKFFSCISNGEGKTIFFKVEDIAKIMAEGNPKSYNWNSHTSMAHFNGIGGTEEDKWNKWEYDTQKKTLNIDGKFNAKDDGVLVMAEVSKYLENKNIEYMLNLYNRNSGDMNSGYRNSGDRNSGYMNSGYRNSGYMNSGNMNSGYRNSGYMNSGYSNSGDMNSGYSNSGDMNSGYSNSGDRNSGDMNSGNMNSGSLINGLCSKKMFFLFNKPCKKKDYQKLVNILNSINFYLTKWISDAEMTDEEKRANPSYSITGGYLRKYEYKEAWGIAFETVSKETISKIKKLKNYNAKVFTEITGVKI